MAAMVAGSAMRRTGAIPRAMPWRDGHDHPTPNGRVANLCFGGENFDTLYAMCGDKVYRRRLKVRGAHAWDAPVKPTAPKL